MLRWMGRSLLLLGEGWKDGNSKHWDHTIGVVEEAEVHGCGKFQEPGAN